MWWIVIAVVILGVLLFETEHTKKITSQLIMVVGGLLSIIGLLILSGQCTVWLRAGRWKSVSMANAFNFFELPIPHPTLGGLTGLQDIADWVEAIFLHLPASLTLFFIGLLVISFGRRRNKRATGRVA
jgi:hypothetical protein